MVARIIEARVFLTLSFLTSFFLLPRIIHMKVSLPSYCQDALRLSWGLGNHKRVDLYKTKPENGLLMLVGTERMQKERLIICRIWPTR